jgi:hypothetical protein
MKAAFGPEIQQSAVDGCDEPIAVALVWQKGHRDLMRHGELTLWPTGKYSLKEWCKNGQAL